MPRALAPAPRAGRPLAPLAPLLLALLAARLPPPAAANSNPNIVFILADDLGFNDVSFHGSDQIPTPNIDALAYSGIILHRHYVQPVCTPTRAALMTSKYPIRMGLQGSPLIPGELRSMPAGKILPEYLRELGYVTHAVGKWHLGFYEAEMTPTHRGFDSHVGYWNGLTSYYDHVMGIADSPEMPRGMYGYDMRINMTTAWGLSGRYATDIFTERAEQVIAQHDKRRPLFLYLAHLAVHAGNNGQLLEAPRPTVDRFRFIDDPNRRTYAAMVTEMDDSVGKVVQALQRRKMLENTIILVISDNGAPTHGLYQNWGSNYPLRGIKDTFWEGGVRSVAALWGPMLSKKQSVLKGTVHVTDWLPTVYAAAGGDAKKLVQPMDGINQWSWLAGKQSSSSRNETLINIDEVQNASALIRGRWKLVQGNKSAEFNDYYGDSGIQQGTPRIEARHVWNSRAGRAIVQTMGKHFIPSAAKMEAMRREATVSCPRTGSTCNITSPEEVCLFDIINDPCEERNLADKYPAVVQQLLERIKAHEANLKAQTDGNMDLADADPQRWSRTWTPWVTCERSPHIPWCNTSPGAFAT